MPKALHDETVLVEGVQEDFEAFADEARGFAPEALQTFRGDASLAYHNAEAGLAAVLARKGDVVESGLAVDWGSLDEIPRIALGLVYAAEQVDGRSSVNVELQRKLTRARVLRDIGLSSAIALEASGEVPAGSVKKLQLGSGPLNLARALVGLASFYKKFKDKVRGKTPFTPAQVKDAAELGRELLQEVKPRGTRTAKPKGLADAQRDRDGFAALLVARYERLERVAGSLWGRGLGEHVPALQSRVQKRARKKPAKTEVSGTKAGDG